MNTHACSLASLSCAALAGCAGPIVLQAERGELHDLHIATARPGFDGAGYVAGFKNDAGELLFRFDIAHAEIYDLHIRYAAPTGGKGYALAVNGVGNDGFFPATPDAFTTFDAGKVELVKGENLISLGKGWGEYEIDALRLEPSAAYAAPKAVAPALVDPHASPEARHLMATLAATYGQKTFPGVTTQDDLDYVRSTTGVTPVVMGGDLMDYSPSRREHGADARGETERLIAAARAGHIVTLAWHWNSPANLIDQKQFVDAAGKTIDASWYRGFYATATTFDYTRALDDEGSQEHQLLLRDIDAIAVELRKLSNAHVPVLWRPLHEADGGWFWWGTRGPDNYKRLWRLLYDRLVVHHALNNLIWVYTWNDDAWYPGDDVVDLVGIDAYPALVNDSLASKWSAARHRFDGNRMVALTEFGGVPDIERMARLGVRWSYFVSWKGAEGPRKNEASDLIRIYRDVAIAKP